MSKGNRIVPVRMDEELFKEVRYELDMRNANSKEAPMTMSDFVRAAIVELIRKRKAGRAPRPAKPKGGAG